MDKPTIQSQSVGQGSTATDGVFNRSDYLNGIEPVWCPGCGDFYVLDSLADALAQLGLPTHMVALISGIGCSSRIPGYMKTYGFNSIHGRPLPIATGLKLSRPEITVVVAAGDGDAFSIGGGHLIHTVRRDVDLSYIVMDNGIYGLTKGQVSPTTPLGTTTKTSEQGAADKPINPLELLLVYGCGFVAQAYASDVKGTTELIKAAIAYPGFSFVNIISPCPTFRGGMGIYKDLRGLVTRLSAESHDCADWDRAFALARDSSKLYHGVLYQHEQRSAEQGSGTAGTRISPVSLQHPDALERIAALAEKYR